MPPNILLFLTDDHAQWALPAYGNAEIHAPALTYLAKNGMVLENAFTPTPVCSPARACLHTGRLASQHGIHDYLAAGDAGINSRLWLDDEITLAQLLHGSGYYTGQVGKWHMGQDEQPHPGYDEWFTMGRGYPIYHQGAHEYGLNGKHQRMEGRITHRLTERAVAFLRDAPADQPFFLTVGFYATHSPWEGQSEWLAAQYRGGDFAGIPQDESYPFGVQNLESTTPGEPHESLAQYFAAVSEIDNAIGRLLDELKSTGRAEETIIIYTSDHGLNCGHHGIWGKGNGTLPLNMVEESIRIPLIWHHPSTISAGRRQEFVDHLDTFQTILEIAGIHPPPDRNYPGRSYLPQLQRQTPPDWRTIQFGEYGALRTARTERFKLLLRNGFGDDELFDLAADPRETLNLCRHPDYKQIVEELTAQISAYFERYEEPQARGTLAADLPQTNFTEAWRS